MDNKTFELLFASAGCSMRYPQDFVDKLICGDVREVIKHIPDNSIDLILTDPPYGLGLGQYDDSQVFYDIEGDLYRVLKENAWLVFYWSIKKLNEVFLKLKLFKYVWLIVNYFPTTYSKSVFGDRKFSPILVFSKGQPKVVTRYCDMVYVSELPFVVEKITNVLFKSTAPTAQLLNMFSQKGQIVLDPFAGYCSIPFVCNKFDRRFIGIEINKKCLEFGQKFLNTGEITTIGNDIEKGLA